MHDEGRVAKSPSAHIRHAFRGAHAERPHELQRRAVVIWSTLVFELAVFLSIFGVVVTIRVRSRWSSLRLLQLLGFAFVAGCTLLSAAAARWSHIAG